MAYTPGVEGAVRSMVTSRRAVPAAASYSHLFKVGVVQGPEAHDRIAHLGPGTCPAIKSASEER